MTRTAVVGVGRWGKNLLRTFHGLGGLWGFAERDPELRALRAESYPDVEAVEGLEDVINRGEAEAVVLATPVVRHFEMCRRALEAGLHVFVEKPITLDVREAEELLDLANTNGRVLMVGHLLLYHPAVTKLKELCEEGRLGELYYLYAQRVNLGQIRRDENAMWSLAPHDISIVLHFFGESPVSVSAIGSSYVPFNRNVEDVVFLNMRFADGRIANIHSSWLDPSKVRRITLVGSHGMALFDDMEPDRRLRIFDKRAMADSGSAVPSSPVPVHDGESWTPELPAAEPLRLEAMHFLECIRTGRQPLSDGKNGLAVLRVLAAAQRSLHKGGDPVKLSTM